MMQHGERPPRFYESFPHGVFPELDAIAEQIGRCRAELRAVRRHKVDIQPQAILRRAEERDARELADAFQAGGLDADESAQSRTHVNALLGDRVATSRKESALAMLQQRLINEAKVLLDQHRDEWVAQTLGQIAQVQDAYLQAIQATSEARQGLSILWRVAGYVADEYSVAPFSADPLPFAAGGFDAVLRSLRADAQRVPSFRGVPSSALQPTPPDAKPAPRRGEKAAADVA